MAYIYANIDISDPEMSINGINVVWWKEVRVYVTLWYGIMLFSGDLQHALARAEEWKAIAPQLHGKLKNGVPYLDDASKLLLAERKLLTPYLAGVKLAEQDIANRAG